MNCRLQILIKLLIIFGFSSLWCNCMMINEEEVGYMQMLKERPNKRKRPTYTIPYEVYVGMIGSLGIYGHGHFVVVKIYDGKEEELCEEKTNYDKNQINLKHKVMYLNKKKGDGPRFERLFLDLENKKYYYASKNQKSTHEGKIYSIDYIRCEKNIDNDVNKESVEDDVSNEKEDDENRNVEIGMTGKLEYKKYVLKFQVDFIYSEEKKKTKVGKYFVSYPESIGDYYWKCETLDLDLQKKEYTAYEKGKKAYGGNIWDIKFPENYFQRLKSNPMIMKKNPYVKKSKLEKGKYFTFDITEGEYYDLELSCKEISNVLLNSYIGNILFQKAKENRYTNLLTLLKAKANAAIENQHEDELSDLDFIMSALAEMAMVNKN